MSSWRFSTGRGVLSNGINSQISEIRVESVGTLISEPDNCHSVSAACLPALNVGGTALSSTYSIDITNVNPAAPGLEPLLISVLSDSPSDYNSGFGAAYPSGAALAAHVITVVEVASAAPACEYGSDLSNKGYNPLYECSPGATQLTLPDDGTSLPVSLGFSFSYAGHPYTSAGVNSNGVLFLGDWDSDPVNLDCDNGWYPLTDCIVANSDDLAPTKGGEVKYETREAGGQTVFVVEWEGVPSFGVSGSASTFQIVLFDSPSSQCDPVLIQWKELHASHDTLIQYGAGDGGIEVCLFDDGGQYEPGSILIAGS